MTGFEETLAYCRTRPAIAIGWPVVVDAPAHCRRLTIEEARTFEGLGLVSDVVPCGDSHLGASAKVKITELGHAIADALR